MIRKRYNSKDKGKDYLKNRSKASCHKRGNYINYAKDKKTCKIVFPAYSSAKT